jgi:hypothetical protein
VSSCNKLTRLRLLIMEPAVAAQWAFDFTNLYIHFCFTILYLLFGFINLYSPCARFVGRGVYLVPSDGIDSPDVGTYLFLDSYNSFTTSPPESRKCFLLSA